MKVAVGCPIRSRAWIFPTYVDHVRQAFEVAGIKPHWIFAVGVGPTSEDDGTHKMVTDLYKTEPGCWTVINEPETRTTREAWTQPRLHEMTEYRNRLLHMVRAYEPDYFLSLDSDILLHPSGLIALYESLQSRKWAAVGGKTYLAETARHITTWGKLNSAGGMDRDDSTGVFPVEVIMAIKLMTPDAYNIDYRYNRIGEDIGWSIACREAGLTLGWDGRFTSKHVMQREHLDRVDRRVGW